MERTVPRTNTDRIIGVTSSANIRKVSVQQRRRICKSPFSNCNGAKERLFNEAFTENVTITDEDIWGCEEISSSNSPGLSTNDTSTDDVECDSSDFDTSLEEDDDEELLSGSASIYLKACSHYDVTPSHAYLRQVRASSADVSHSMLGTPDIKAICVSLINNYHIQTLDLSGNNIGNRGADYLTQCLLENSYITCLRLTSANIDPEGITLLMDLMKENKTITTLDISDNQVKGYHAKCIGDALEVNDHLSNLYVSYCGIDEIGGKSISKALVHNVSLKILDLSWNHLRTQGAEDICRALKENCSLEVLNLSWNGLGLEGCEELSTSLNVNQSLRDLDLSCNRIDLSCLKVLLKGLSTNTYLETLKLGKNPITPEGANDILRSVQSWPSCRISSLDITGIPLDNEFSKVLKEVKRDKELTVIHSEDYHQYQMGTFEKQPSLNDYDPVIVLFEYMRQGNFRLIDFFRSVDTDNSNTISRDELRKVFKSLDISLSDRHLDDVMKRLDMDHNHEIDIDELRLSQRKSMRQLQALTKWSKHKSEDKFAEKLKVLVREALDNKHKRSKDTWKKTLEKVKI